MRHILFTIKFPGKVNVGTCISESQNLLFAHQIADAITIKNGESLYVPPSYKMTFHSSLSYSQDSYGGMPDFSVSKVDQLA